MTPLKLNEWSLGLLHHPDREFVSYILLGIKEGFRIGFNRTCPLRDAGSNMPNRNPEVIVAYLEREVALGRMLSCPADIQGVHVSPMGIIPKRNKPGKWRMIVDLSSPPGGSLNDGIGSEQSSLSYTTIDHLSTLILDVGKGAFLVKADIKEAYRMIPVHPEDQPLLGIRWNGRVYVDRVLPFGLRSAPKIFSAVADALQWMLVEQGCTRTLHYLDDYILVAENCIEAERQRQVLVSTFERAGVPLEPSKLEGPSTCLVFLGIEVDTSALQLRLPEAKLLRLRGELREAVGRKVMTRRELQSLSGLLQHATKVVRPGRAFLRNLYALQSVGSRPSHNVRLNVHARADILWWHLFVPRWSGMSILWDRNRLQPQVTVYSDASGHWGCGAYCLPKWLQLQWTPELRSTSIQVQELAPIVMAAAVFGKDWTGKSVQFVVDNLAVVSIVRATYSTESHLMHLVRVLCFFAAFHGFWFTAEHIAGVDNSLADAISRDNEGFFLSQVPQAARRPTDLPKELVDLIAANIPWTSTTWTRLFDSIIQQL